MCNNLFCTIDTMPDLVAFSLTSNMAYLKRLMLIPSDDDFELIPDLPDLIDDHDIADDDINPVVDLLDVEPQGLAIVAEMMDNWGPAIMDAAFAIAFDYAADQNMLDDVEEWFGENDD